MLGINNDCFLFGCFLFCYLIGVNTWIFSSSVFKIQYLFLWRGRLSFRPKSSAGLSVYIQGHIRFSTTAIHFYLHLTDEDLSFLKILLFIFIFGCAGSLLLHGLFSSCSEQGLLLSCHVQASHWGSFSCCGAWALGCVGFSSCGLWALEHRLNNCAVA